MIPAGAAQSHRSSFFEVDIACYSLAGSVTERFMAEAPNENCAESFGIRKAQ
jgi:hypothetical protein